MRFLAGLIIGFSIPISIGAIIALSGSFDVSAARPADPIEKWLATLVLNLSVAKRAPMLESAREDSSAMLAEGFAHFRANCLPCHGAPGVESFEFADGLQPAAPHLTDIRTQARTDGEIFWITSHGIRLTGMPGFSSTHSEPEIRAIVAFVHHLSEITPEEQDVLRGAHEAQAHRHEGDEAAEQGVRERHAHPLGTLPHAD